MAKCMMIAMVSRIIKPGIFLSRGGTGTDENSGLDVEEHLELVGNLLELILVLYR